MTWDDHSKDLICFQGFWGMLPSSKQDPGGLLAEPLAWAGQELGSHWDLFLFQAWGILNMGGAPAPFRRHLWELQTSHREEADSFPPSW